MVEGMRGFGGLRYGCRNRLSGGDDGTAVTGCGGAGMAAL